MKKEIFRKEAIESIKNKNTQFGETLTDKDKGNLLIFFILIITLILIFSIFFFELNDKVEASGIIDYKKKDIVVKMPEDGYISDLYVKNGDNVDKNTKIAKYHTDISNSDKFENIKNDKKNMIVILKRKKESISNKKTILEKDLITTLIDNDLQINSLNKKLKNSNFKIKNMSSTVARYKRGYSENSISYDELDSKILILTDEKINNENLMSDIDILKKQKINIVSKNKMEIQNLISDEISVDEEIAKLKTELSIVDITNNKYIYANQNGKIEFIFDQSNDTLAKHDFIARIVPNNNSLQALVYIKGDALVEIKKGTKVKIKVDGIPYQKYGLLNGEVFDISESPHIIDNSKSYIGYIKFNNVEDYPQLKAKMEIKIDVLKNRIKLYQWIFGK